MRIDFFLKIVIKSMRPVEDNRLQFFLRGKKMKKLVKRKGYRLMSLISAIAVTGTQIYVPVNVNAEETGTWEKTDLIENGDFESGDLSGWSVEMPDSDGNAMGYKTKIDEWASNNKTNIFNYWSNDKSAYMELSQEISSVPAGEYKLSFDVEGAEAGSGLELSISGKNVPINTNGWDNWTTLSTENFMLDEETDLKLTVSGDISEGYWGDLDNFVLYKLKTEDEAIEDEDNKEKPENPDEDNKDKDKDKEQQEAIEADIFVDPVDGVDDDFITGVDVSSYRSLKAAGIKYYDYDGNELSDAEFFKFLKNCGVNYVRLRVWNNPSDSNGNGYGGGNCDLENAITMGKWITNAGMKVLIDFHYSDFWADPGKQSAPKAWKNMSMDEKQEALNSFTVDSLQKLIDAGVDVGMVQVGNETNNGIAGESSWENMAKLFSAGSKGVRQVAEDNDKDILVAVHFTNPETSGRYAGYAKKLDEYKVDYDVFASSYYPYWHGTLSNLNSVLSEIADKYDKKVMVAETSYVYTLEDGDGCENTEREGKAGDVMNFDVSVQGQADSVRSVISTVASIDNGIGVFYWEPAWLPVQVYDPESEDAEDVLSSNKEAWEKYGCGWAASYAGEYDKDVKEWGGGGAVVENEAWFDFSGHALASANIYKFVRTGATAKVKVIRVDTEDVECEVGSEITLPENATVVYNNGDKVEKKVTWNESELEKAKEEGVGEYTIHGTVSVDEKQLEATCKLTIKSKNYLINAGFEDGNTGWTINDIGNKDGQNGVAAQADSSNVRTGSKSLKYWDNEPIEFVVEQKVTLDKGIYKLGAFVEGGDCGDDADFILFAKSGEEEQVTNTTVTGWQNWANPEVSDIKVKADATEVTVGVRVKAVAGGWGAWDDFYLYRVADIAEESGDDSDNDDEEIDDPDDDNDDEEIDDPGTGKDGDEDIDNPDTGKTDDEEIDNPDDNSKDEEVIVEEIKKAVETFVKVYVAPVVREIHRIAKKIFGWWGWRW